MNNVGAREPVSFCRNGLIADTPAQLPGSRAAITCKPISRLRSISGHSGAVAAGLPTAAVVRNSCSSSIST